MVKWLKVINLLLDEFGVGYRAERAKRSISSREVAEMMEVKEHSKVIRKIEQISTTLTEAKIGLSDYWFESTYIDGKSETVFRVISIRLNSIKNMLYRIYNPNNCKNNTAFNTNSLQNYEVASNWY